MDYPPAPTHGSVTEVLHGVKVVDTYRSLEDPDAESTASWVNLQNDLFDRHVARAAPTGAKERFRAKIESLMDYDRYSPPWREGEFWYYYVRKGLANQPVILQARSIDEKGGESERVFLDPNTMAADGTTSLANVVWSMDGKLVAYGTNAAGSDWEQIRVMDSTTLKVFDEVLDWAKFTAIAWTADGKGFYYSRYPKPKSLQGREDMRGAETDSARNHAVYYHVVGTSQEEDRLIYTDPEYPTRLYQAQTTRDGKYLLLVISKDCSPKSMLRYADLTAHFGEEQGNFTELVGEDFEADFVYIANDDDAFYFKTNWKAPNCRVVKAKLQQAAEEWETVVEPHEQNVLTKALAVNGDMLALTYMEHAKHKLSLHELRTGTKLHDVQLPDLGAIPSIQAARHHSFFTYSFTSFLYPGTVFHVDLTKPFSEATTVFRSMTPPDFDPSLFETKQVFFTAKDGVTRIPMFIVGPKGMLSESGPNGELRSQTTGRKPPCLLYGYGGFCIPMVPGYSARWASWMSCLNGIVVVANLRGGNEYGEEWHNQGIIDKKQNVFDDFQQAARALVQEFNVTTAESLLIMGGSNGGLLVGACVNQAPELFGAAIAQVGVMDMLRFHKFTIGSAWVSDFGDPDNEEHFRHLIKYSPLHNVFNPDERGVPYPAVLLTTGDHDDRVVPLHTLKFGATLQAVAGKSKLQEQRPLLMRIEVRAGHGAGKPTAKVIDEMCDTLLFAAIALKVDV